MPSLAGIALEGVASMADPTKIVGEKQVLSRSGVAHLLDHENVIGSLIGKAKRARLNASGGWGDRAPVPAVASALVEIGRSTARFHAATRYSEPGGLSVLREAIAGALDTAVFRRRGVSADNIVVASGGSTQLGFQALLLFGSPVLLLDPTYANYMDQARLMGLEVMRLPVLGAEGEFLPRESPGQVLHAFERLCQTSPPASVVIVSPDNPTGFIWPDEVLNSFIRIAERHHVAVVLDRAYGAFFFETRPDHLSWSPATYPNLVALESFSKSFSLLGLRLGYAISTPSIATYLEALTQRITLCPGTPEQLAVAEFLCSCGPTEIEAYLEAARGAYRSAFILSRALLADAVPYLQSLSSDGGFYLVFRLPEPDADDRGFCDALFTSERLLVVPGSAFGQTTRGWVRTSFAPHVTSPERLEAVYGTLAAHLGQSSPAATRSAPPAQAPPACDPTSPTNPIVAAARGRSERPPTAL